jgi:hypothetical protein
MPLQQSYSLPAAADFHVHLRDGEMSKVGFFSFFLSVIWCETISGIVTMYLFIFKNKRWSSH